MVRPVRLDIVFAAEHLVPPVGGAELWALEALEALAERHTVRAVWIDGGDPARWRPTSLPPHVEGTTLGVGCQALGYWRTKELRRRALGEAVHDLASRRRPDVLLTQLHAAPDAIEAAGVPAVLVLHSYENLCKHAFGADSDCVPARDCASCPAAARLDGGERAAMLASRAAHERALRHAAELIAVGPAVRHACEEWVGRSPTLMPPLTRMPALPARPPPLTATRCCARRAGGRTRAATCSLRSHARWPHERS